MVVLEWGFATREAVSDTPMWRLRWKVGGASGRNGPIAVFHVEQDCSLGAEAVILLCKLRVIIIFDFRQFNNSFKMPFFYKH